jgi:hypothetical protein
MMRQSFSLNNAYTFKEFPIFLVKANIFIEKYHTMHKKFWVTTFEKWYSHSSTLSQNFSCILFLSFSLHHIPVNHTDRFPVKTVTFNLASFFSTSVSHSFLLF